jgi:hypothetical protein
MRLISAVSGVQFPASPPKQIKAITLKGYGFFGFFRVKTVYKCGITPYILIYLLCLSCVSLYGNQVGYGNQFKHGTVFAKVALEIVEGKQGGKMRMTDTDGFPMP